MDIINIRSSVTMLVCCVALAGFFLEDSPRHAQHEEQPRLVQPAPPVAPRASAPAPDSGEDLPLPETGPDQPDAHVPAEIGGGVRLASAPLQPVNADAAQRALAEDIEAALD